MTTDALNQACLLVVDDDQEIRELLQQFLQQHGYRVLLAEQGDAMRQQLAAHAVDLIVMDLMLPGEDGLQLCRWVQNSQRPLPVIMLTALGEETDRIVGLELGADDYLAKPFNPRELLARIRAVLRRSAHRDVKVAGVSEAYEFAGWHLNVMRRELCAEHHATQTLSAGEFELLMVLLDHPQQVLSRDQLLDKTRGIDADPYDRSIDIQISRLRKKLGDAPRQAQIIQTVRNGGYVLQCPVNKVGQ